MNIVLFAETYPPDVLGGAAITCEILARNLRRLGHRVDVLLTAETGTPQPSVQYGVSTPDLAGQILDRLSPDAVIATGRKTPALLAGSRRPGRRILFYLQDAASTSVPAAATADACVFASDYLRRLYNENFGLGGPVIPPLIEAARYSGVSSTRARVVAFGLARVKRADITSRIAARLPSLDFDIFHTWGRRYDLRNLGLLLRPNVRILQPVDDPAMVYGEARVILVPSNSEGWCRVATEAQFAGIPTIARAVGALPESVGPGGILLPHDASIADWVAALRRIFEDQDHYRALTEGARAASTRDIVSIDANVARWEAVLRAT